MKKINIILAMFCLQLLLIACNTNKEIVGTYMNKSSFSKDYVLPKIELESLNRFKYLYSFDGYRRTSEGIYEVQGNKIYFTSDFPDTLCDMKVIELSDDSLNGIEFVIDSNFSSNYSICVLKVYLGESETILPCIGSKDQFTIADSTLKNVVSFQFAFTNHFFSKKYVVSNRSSKKFIVKLFMPNDTDTYEIFNKTKGRISRRKIKIENVVYRKVDRS